MTKVSLKSKRWITPLAWLIGLVFLAAAFLKAWDIRQFAIQISYYKLLPSSLELPAAFVVVALESLIGICLITGFRRTLALSAGAGLLIIFLAATGFRWNLLQGKDCGCFGSFDRGGPEAVLWQDTLLLLFVGIVFKFRERVLEFSRQRLATLLVVLLCVATAAYSEIIAKTSVASMDQPVQGQLNIVVYLSSTCPHCIANGEKINRILKTPNLPPAQTYLAAENESQIVSFLQESHLTVPYNTIPFSFLWLMTKSVPSLELRRGKTIVARWDGEMPPPEVVLEAVAAQFQDANSKKSTPGS